MKAAFEGDLMPPRLQHGPGRNVRDGANNAIPRGSGSRMPDEHMGGSTRPKATAEGIVQAAERLFSQCGYHKATVAALAEGLGMSPANIYRFFRSKEDLRCAVVCRILDASYAMALRISRQSISAAMRIRQCLRAQHRIAAGLVAHRAMLHELIVLSLEHDRGLFDSHIARIGELLAAVIAEGIDGGEFAERAVQPISRVFIMATAKVWHPKLLSSAPCGAGSNPDDLIDFALGALKHSGGGGR